MIDFSSLVLGFMLGIVKDLVKDFIYKENQKKYHLLEVLYVPYRKLHSKNHSAAAYNFHDLDETKREAILTLLNDTIYYTKYYPELFSLVLDLTSLGRDPEFIDKSNEDYNKLNRMIFELSDLELVNLLPFRKKYFNLKIDFKLIPNKYSFKVSNLKTIEEL